MISLRYRAAVLALACAGALTLYAQSSNPFQGKWMLNVAKSKFSPGPAPKSETVTVDNGTTTVEGVDGQGQSYKWSFTPTEGKAVPIEGMPNGMVETKGGTGNTVDHTWSTPAGKTHGHGVVSKNGKTMRYTLTGTDATGKPVHDVDVFEKQ